MRQQTKTITKIGITTTIGTTIATIIAVLNVDVPEVPEESL
jgi:hypothetical protein